MSSVLTNRGPSTKKKATQWESEAFSWTADCIKGLLSSWQLLPDNAISRRSLQNSQLMGLKWCDVCCWHRCWRRRWRRWTILLLVKIYTHEGMTQLHFTDFTVSPALLLWDYSLHNLSSLSINLLWARVPAGNSHMLYFHMTAVANNNFHRYTHIQAMGISDKWFAQTKNVKHGS